MDRSTLTQALFASLPSSQLFIRLSEDPQAEEQNRCWGKCLEKAPGVSSNMCKQHSDVNRQVCCPSRAQPYSISISPNPSSPFRSLYSSHRSPPENLSFLLLLSWDSTTLCHYWKKAMWSISDPRNQISIPLPLFVFLEAFTNISLLENKNAKLVSISVLDRHPQETCPELLPQLHKLRGYWTEV